MLPHGCPDQEELGQIAGCSCVGVCWWVVNRCAACYIIIYNTKEAEELCIQSRDTVWMDVEGRVQRAPASSGVGWDSFCCWRQGVAGTLFFFFDTNMC